MPEPQYFPIQNGNEVLLEDAEKAYATYVKLFGTQASVQRLKERGGFERHEFAALFRGQSPLDYPKKDCPQCGQCGTIVNSEEGGIVQLCGVCMGAGAV